MTQHARDFADEWIGYINIRDFEGLRSLYADDIYEDLPSTQHRVEGADAMVDSYREWTEAFPDLHGTLNAVHQDGASLTIEATFAGTWTEPLQRPGALQQTPTNQAMSIDVCEILELNGRTIVGARAYYDMLSILQQIGVLPSGTASA
jgi:hypothetical protein